MKQDLADAGLRTLSYAAVFRQGLTRSQLSRFLITSDLYTTGSVYELWNAWKTQGFVKKSTLSPQRPHWEKALAIKTLASWIPWVQSVWVTGSLAAGTARVDDDIDFLVITDANRLWISRFFLVGLSVFFGRARTRNMLENNVRDRWCFNMWLEPSQVALSPELQNLYTAREVAQAVPIFIRPGVFAQDFLLKNMWVQKYFARGWQIAYKKSGGLSRSAESEIGLESFRPTSWLDAFNSFAWKWQKKRMDRNKTREIVERDKAFFHPRDTRTSVSQEYERICTLHNLQPYA